MTGARPIRKEACTLIKSFANPKKETAECQDNVQRGKNGRNNPSSLHSNSSWTSSGVSR